MTNHWADLENAKVFLIEGSNAAENHPMAMKWIRKAQEKGAKIIHVDPRYNRTSNIADVFARIRPGADIAFLGAVIRLVIENGTLRTTKSPRVSSSLRVGRSNAPDASSFRYL